MAQCCLRALILAPKCVDYYSRITVSIYGYVLIGVIFGKIRTDHFTCQQTTQTLGFSEKKRNLLSLFMLLFILNPSILFGYVSIESEMGFISEKNLLRNGRIFLEHFKSPLSEAQLLENDKRL